MGNADSVPQAGENARASGKLPLKNPRHEKLAREYAAGAPEFLRGDFNKMAGISLAALQARLLRVADHSIVDLFEADAAGRLRLRDLTKLPTASTMPITELRIDGDGAIKVKTADKLHAIDSLLKTIGGFAASGPENGLGLETLVIQSMQLVTAVQRSEAQSPMGAANAELIESHSAGSRRVRLNTAPRSI
jgi:hypothetical protein